MTMMCAVVQGGKAYLFSDTAYCDPATGAVVGFEPKMVAGVLEGLPRAIGVTFVGNPKATQELTRLNVAGVDELVDELPGAVAAVKVESARLGWPNASLRLIVAVWDERCGTSRIFLAGDGAETYPETPWCPPGVRELAYFFGADEGIAAEVATLWGSGSPNDPTTFDLYRDGIEAFEIRRRKPFKPLSGMPEGFYVGGELHVAEVRQDGVEAAIWRQWPDKIGKRIEPA